MSSNNFEFSLNFRWTSDADNSAPDASQKAHLESISVMKVLPLVAEGFREGDLHAFALSGEHQQGEFHGHWALTEKQTEAREFGLPFGVRIQTTTDGAVQFNSDLLKYLTGAEASASFFATASVNAIEVFLKAMASRGVDLSDPAISSALQDVVREVDIVEKFSNPQPCLSEPEDLESFVIYSANEAATLDGRGYWGGTLVGWTHAENAEVYPGKVLDAGYALPQSLGQDRRWLNMALQDKRTEEELCAILDAFCAVHDIAPQCAQELLHTDLTPSQRVWLEQFSNQWEDLTSVVES